MTTITVHKTHPAFSARGDLEIIFYQDTIDFGDLFKTLKQEYGVDNVIIQSGGTLNAILVRAALIDRISLVIAPALVGGKSTSTVMDGISPRTESESGKIKALKLQKCEKLENSYIHLVYDVMN